MVRRAGATGVAASAHPEAGVPEAQPVPSARGRAGGLPWRRELLALGAILLLALALRTGWPTLAEFKFDEARLIALALELTREGRLPLAGLPSSAGFAHSPISVYLYVPVFLVTGSPLAATVYSGLVGVVAVALAWWLARSWPGSGPWGHRLAGLLLAASPWLVVFNRKVWQIAFVPALALAFVGLAVSALVEGRHRHLAWAVVAYALLVQVHPSAVGLAPAFLLWLVLFRRHVKAGPLALGVLLGIATTVPYLVYQVREGWPLLAALQALPGAVTDLQAVRLAASAISGSDIHALAGDDYPLLGVVPRLAQTFHLATGLAVAGIAILGWRVLRDWRAPGVQESRAARVDLVLISWLVVPILFNLRHSLDLYLHSFALVVPAACLIIARALGAFGTDRGQERAGRRAIRVAGLAVVAWLVTFQVVVLVLMARFVAGHDTPGGFGRPLGQTLAVAGRAVDTLEREGAAEVLVVGQGDLPATDQTPAIFDAVLRDRVPYRFVDGESAAVFPPHPAVALIAPDSGEGSGLYGSQPAEELPGGYRLVHLDGSWPVGTLAPFPGPRTFENGVELQGYGWQGTAVPGGEIDLWLLWQVLWSSPDDTHFFVHLLDGDGRQIGQQDTEGYPTAYRRTGDHVLSRFRIDVAEQAGTGAYSIRVGMYRYPEVVNLSLLDEAGNPAGQALVVDLAEPRPSE
ncbi:MAG TPA: hypothetical protein VLC52_02995 [Anaerolineae bacterium]|nr:hypothetical protein [Anaerolineae bacterium]